MSPAELTTKRYWSDVWRGVRLPQLARPTGDVHDTLVKLLPVSTGASFLEVGCAPGGWMAYFHRRFGYKVYGVEYVEAAARLTVENLRMQGIEAEVATTDFFEHSPGAELFDVVFSAGFVEHFSATSEVVGKIASTSKRFVVTMVPNLLGINGWIVKMTRPRVYQRHVPIGIKRLKEAHEDAGLRTLLCGYVSGPSLYAPADQRPFFERWPRLAAVLNMPVVAFNVTSAIASGLTGIYPNTRFGSRSLLYVGEKR